MLDHLDRLPDPQRDALATVFGRSPGPTPDRFLVGLATLTLLAEVAEEQPLVCIVDDAHWLDQASVQILGFVARRLLAERIAIVCAARTGIGDDVLAGLPELSLRGLGDADARALLLGSVRGPLDAAVRDQIITESRGNPLALLELPRTWNVADLAGGFGLPASRPATSTIEQSYVRRLLLLPPNTRLLVLTAAAEPLGDPVLLYRAAETLGLDAASADPAVDAGLLQVGGRVEFAHPLVRSAAYRSADADDRHRVHRALADATDPETDPDRRAWHRARATLGPDEEVAEELERSAGRAQARGGLAAAAAFLERAAELTPEPERARPEGAGGCRRASTSRGRRRRRCGCSPSRARGRSASSTTPAHGSCGPRSRSSRPAAGMRRPCCSTPPGGSSRWIRPLARETYLEAFARGGLRGTAGPERRRPRDRGGGARGGVGRPPRHEAARLRPPARRPRASRGPWVRAPGSPG